MDIGLQEYKTRDFPFACYLMSRGSIFMHMEKTGDKDTLLFCLGVPKDIDVAKTWEFWQSNEAELYKKVLRSASILKAELSRFYKQNKDVY